MKKMRTKKINYTQITKGVIVLETTMSDKELNDYFESLKYINHDVLNTMSIEKDVEISTWGTFKVDNIKVDSIVYQMRTNEII